MELGWESMRASRSVESNGREGLLYAAIILVFVFPILISMAVFSMFVVETWTARWEKRLLTNMAVPPAAG